MDVELRKVSKEVEEAKQETEALRKVGSQIDELFEGVRRGRQLEKKDREQLNEEVEKVLDKSGLDCEDTLEKEEHLL